MTLGRGRQSARRGRHDAVCLNLLSATLLIAADAVAIIDFAPLMHEADLDLRCVFVMNAALSEVAPVN